MRSWDDQSLSLRFQRLDLSERILSSSLAIVLLEYEPGAPEGRIPGPQLVT